MDISEVDIGKLVYCVPLAVAFDSEGNAWLNDTYSAWSEYDYGHQALALERYAEGFVVYMNKDCKKRIDDRNRLYFHNSLFKTKIFRVEYV